MYDFSTVKANLEQRGFAVSCFATAEEATAYLDGKLGEAVDYASDGMPRTLLMEYVRYVRDSALDVFEGNYLALLLDMRHERAVRRYAERAVPAP